MTRRIHIALVGGQTMPVHIGIETLESDCIYLIHSDKSKDEAERIKEVWNDRNISFYKMAAVDFPAVWQEADQLLSLFEDDIVDINVSSGTKPWTVAFAMLSAKRDNIHLFYIDQNNRSYDLKNRTTHQISVDFNIEKILRYNNQSTPSYTNVADYTEEDESVLTEVINARKWNFRDFNALTIPTGKDKTWKNILQNDPHPEKRLETGSILSYDKKQKTITLKIINRKWGAKAWHLTSPHIGNIVLNTGWFEYQVASMLQRWRRCKEIWVNVKFPYDDGRAKNEIDIIVNMGGKLLFVECKTSIYDNTDIDKFNNAVKNYGGMGCKALFVTDDKIRPVSLQKCKDSGIMTFCLKDETKKMKKDRELFDMLEKEMTNINKK